jgi:hypothetical protein
VSAGHDLGTYISCQVRCAPLWSEAGHQVRVLVANCDPDQANNKQWFTSPDGIQWTREKTIPGGSSAPLSNKLGPSYMVVYDANSSQPYKTVRGSYGGVESNDGLTWHLTHSALGIERGDEANLSYDPESGRYIYTMKRFANNTNGRAVAVATTTDFAAQNWTGELRTSGRRPHAWTLPIVLAHRSRDYLPL